MPAKPKSWMEGGDLREAQVEVPCLLGIPAFDHIAVLYNRHPKSNREICLL
jgi:hypothetical protein